MMGVKLQGKDVRALKNGVIAVCVCVVVQVAGSLLNAPEWVSGLLGIALGFIAVVTLSEPAFDLYMRWRHRRVSAALRRKDR